MARRDGFSFVESLVIVVVLVILGAVGYLAYTNLLVPTQKDTAQTTASSSTQPLKVEKASDLDTVSDELDQLQIESSDDNAKLDDAANAF